MAEGKSAVTVAVLLPERRWEPEHGTGAGQPPRRLLLPWLPLRCLMAFVCWTETGVAAEL